MRRRKHERFACRRSQSAPGWRAWLAMPGGGLGGVAERCWLRARDAWLAGLVMLPGTLSIKSKAGMSWQLTTG